MYKVSRTEAGVFVEDWKGQVVYSATTDAIVMYQTANGIATSRVSQMSDEQLLTALAKAVKLPL